MKTPTHIPSQPGKWREPQGSRWPSPEQGSWVLTVHYQPQSDLSRDIFLFLLTFYWSPCRAQALVSIFRAESTGLQHEIVCYNSVWVNLFPIWITIVGRYSLFVSKWSTIVEPSIDKVSMSADDGFPAGRYNHLASCNR